MNVHTCIAVKTFDSATLRMTYRPRKFYSIEFTRFLMRTVGFWNAETKTEQFILNCFLAYMLVTISIALIIESLDFYYTWGDFYAFTYTACSVMPIVIILMKVALFLPRRKQFMQVIKYNQDNFWYKEYDAHGTKILKELDKKGMVLICSFTFFVQGTVVTYMLAPIVENLGKNETDRVLPFTIWIDAFPSTQTPYFEVMFTVQTLSLIHSGVCFCCFDNFLTILCIHAAGQFKILQRKIQMILLEEQTEGTEVENLRNAEEANLEFKSCIGQHCELMRYIRKLDQMFSYSTLCQLLVSSIMLCVAGFQVVTATGTLVRRLIFYAHVTGCFFQIFIITLTMNEVILESRAIADAAYSCKWEVSSHRSYAKVRRGIVFMIMKSNIPCYISAGGYFPVSLETFMAVLSTAASYFALLQNIEMETVK